MPKSKAISEIVLTIRLLGHVTVTAGDASVVDMHSRSHQTWLMLSYLACNRSRLARQEELIRLIGADEGSDNPGGILKTAVWRMRKTLKPVSDVLGADLVINKNGAYQLNPELNVHVDVEEFEDLLSTARRAISEQERLDALFKAFDLHGGGRFLEKFAGNSWVDALATHYDRLFFEASLEALPLMINNGEAVQAERLSRYALTMSPYNEQLFRHLLESLMAQGKYEDAVADYDDLCGHLFAEFGIMPEAQTQAIYHELLSRVGERSLSLEEIVSDLGEQNPVSGALLCDYARFKLYYQAEARSAARRGESINIGLLTVKGKTRKKLSANTLKSTMDALRDNICADLRMGDVVTQCSSSQFIFMLLQANYESSLKVCRRLVDAFEKAHPRSPAQVSATVLPLEPLHFEP